MTTKNPVRIIITGAAGQIGYSLAPLIASGQMLGPDQPVILHLLEIEPARQSLEGVVMELQDGAYPLLKGVVPTCDPEVAFRDVDICLLCGAFPRKQGMQRSELLEKNIEIFSLHGQIIERVASRNVKVLVVGNPANTNCLVLRHFAPSIPDKNFSALTRLDHNRAVGEIAQRLNVAADLVKNVIIWGNHSDTQYPDVNHGVVVHGNSSQPIKAAINNDEFLHNDFINFVQKRGGVIIQKRGLSSALSASKAIVDHVKNWVLGTEQGSFVSMAVISDGSYGIERGLIYSFPCECANGEYRIVHGLDIDNFSREKMNKTMEELIGERDLALSIIQKK